MNLDFDDDWDQEDDRQIACPHCGEGIFDDVEQCPYCRMYLSSADFNKPVSRWWVLAVLLVILGLLLPIISHFL